jgi:hypothetical protein
MGFKDDVREKAEEFERDMASLKGRVSALETLAGQLKNSAPAVHAAAHSTYDGVTGSSRSSLPVQVNEATGVDYGAIAFGLSDLKRKARNSGVSGVSETFAGAVQYFADVFSKSDPSFNEADFKRQAGV